MGGHLRDSRLQTRQVGDGDDKPSAKVGSVTDEWTVKRRSSIGWYLQHDRSGTPAHGGGRKSTGPSCPRYEGARQGPFPDTLHPAPAHQIRMGTRARTRIDGRPTCVLVVQVAKKYQKQRSSILMDLVAGRGRSASERAVDKFIRHGLTNFPPTPIGGIPPGHVTRANRTQRPHDSACRFHVPVKKLSKMRRHPR